MYYEELRSAIKERKIAPLYIFEGPEEYLIDFCIGELKKALVEEWSEMMNYQSHTELPPVNEAGDFMETLPVMSERKLIVFRKCGLFEGNIKNKAEWENILSNVAPYNCVVIWEKQPEKGKKQNTVRKAAEKGGAVVVEFPLRTEGTLRSWVSKIAAASVKSAIPPRSVRSIQKSRTNAIGRIRKRFPFICHLLFYGVYEKETASMSHRNSLRNRRPSRAAEKVGSKSGKLATKECGFF